MKIYPEIIRHYYYYSTNKLGAFDIYYSTTIMLINTNQSFVL